MQGLKSLYTKYEYCSSYGSWVLNMNLISSARCWQMHLWTEMILSFRTEKPGQTVQTQIRLLLSLIRVYTVCHSVCIVWTHYSMVEPHSSNFTVITTNFWGVRIFRTFTVRKAWKLDSYCAPCWGRYGNNIKILINCSKEMHWYKEKGINCEKCIQTFFAVYTFLVGTADEKCKKFLQFS